MQAAFRGQTETVGALLGAGADVHAKTNNGVSPLMHAAFGGHIETVETLLDAGVDVNAKDDDGATSLMYSFLVRGDVDLVKLLLDAGADVSEKSNDGWMALMLAEEEGHTEVVERHQYTQVPEQLELGNSVFDGVHRGAFGQFEFELRRVEVVACQCALHHLHENRLVRAPEC